MPSQAALSDELDAKFPYAAFDKGEEKLRARFAQISRMTPEEKKREIEKLEKAESEGGEEEERYAGPRRNRSRLNVERVESGAAERMDEESLFVNFVARQAVQLPPTISRQWFDQVVATTVVLALKEAAQAGALQDLFGGQSPKKSELDVMTMILAEMIDADNPRLHAKCMAFVLAPTLLGGRSEIDIGREEHLGRSAISKRCIRIREIFGLPPSRGMKKDSAREAYRKRQKGKRARAPREAWAFHGLLGGVYAH